MIDDHSRLAYTELHRNERGPTVVGFVERAIAFFRGHGIEPRRLQSDNAWTYTKNRDLAELPRPGADRPPHHRGPDTEGNGKVERYQQILKREWGLGQRYRSSAHRAEALHIGSSTATTPDATVRSATGLRSPAFGTS